MRCCNDPPPSHRGPSWAGTPACALLVALLGAGHPVAPTFSAQPDHRPPHHTTFDLPLIFAQTTSPQDGRNSDGHPEQRARIVRLDPGGEAPAPRVLSATLPYATRPDVSFDGQRVLFIGRESTADPRTIWEMNIDGTGLRQVASGVGDCRAAIYLSTISTMTEPQPRPLIAFCSQPHTGVAPQLYTCRPDGSDVRQITFNPYGASEPFLLSDGRLLFSSAHGPSTAQQPRPAATLHTVNVDGADVFLFAENTEPDALDAQPCETDTGRVVFVHSPPGANAIGGRLRSVSRTRSLHSSQQLTTPATGLFQTPRPLDRQTLLVAHRAPGAPTYGLAKLTLDSSTMIAGIYDDPEWDDLYPAVVAPRPQPHGRSSVVDVHATRGLLYCLDAGLTDGQSGAPPQTAPPARVAIFSATATGTGAFTDHLLGIVPLESDGSFHVELPARTPLRLETQDAAGRVLRTMKSWMWVMPREARGCIGCHEDRELSPPNRHPLALRKPPVVLDAAEKPPLADLPGEGGP